MGKKLFIEVIHGYAKYHGYYSGSTMEVNHSVKLIMGPKNLLFEAILVKFLQMWGEVAPCFHIHGCRIVLLLP